MYIDVAREIGPDIPLEVANDGDVTALAGAMDLNENAVMGIAMGTSEAGGYVDKNGTSPVGSTSSPLSRWMRIPTPWWTNGLATMAAA